MLLIKAAHLIAMVAWFAGLFYLPRLFVYHAQSADEISIERFKIMERRLYYGITWPAALFTSSFGISLFLYYPKHYLHAPWMHAKLSLVFLLWIYHLLCGHYLRCFSRDKNTRTPLFYRIFNEIPTLLLVGIIGLVVIKPF